MTKFQNKKYGVLPKNRPLTLFHFWTSNLLQSFRKSNERITKKLPKKQTNGSEFIGSCRSCWGSKKCLFEVSELIKTPFWWWTPPTSVLYLYLHSINKLYHLKCNAGSHLIILYFWSQVLSIIAGPFCTTQGLFCQHHDNYWYHTIVITSANEI